MATAKRSDPDAVDIARRIDPAANRAHMDIGVDDVDVAIAQVEKIGGRSETRRPSSPAHTPMRVHVR